MIRFIRLKDDTEHKCIFCGNKADYIYVYTTSDNPEVKEDELAANTICSECNKIVPYIVNEEHEVTFYSSDEYTHIAMQKVIRLRGLGMSLDESYEAVFGISPRKVDDIAFQNIEDDVELSSLNLGCSSSAQDDKGRKLPPGLIGK